MTSSQDDNETKGDQMFVKVILLMLLVASSFSTPVKGSATIAALTQAKGWRGIVPLRSTRKDVELVLGSPQTPRGSSYQTVDNNVFVQYSDGPCEKGWPYGWSVPADTVVTITVTRKNKITLAELNIDESKYEKWQAGHVSHIVHYTNRNEGVDFEVDELERNLISVSFIPTAAESSLQCPDAQNRLPPGRRQADSFFKFDELGDTPVSYEHERLDLFAAEMNRQPDSIGYIIAYAGMIAHASEAKKRADCARNYLIKKHRMRAGKILAIDGGYRETRVMELYVEPRGGDVPLARPSVRPSKVKILEPSKPIACENKIRGEKQKDRKRP